MRQDSFTATVSSRPYAFTIFYFYLVFLFSFGYSASQSVVTTWAEFTPTIPAGIVGPKRSGQTVLREFAINWERERLTSALFFTASQPENEKLIDIIALLLSATFLRPLRLHETLSPRSSHSLLAVLTNQQSIFFLLNQRWFFACLLTRFPSIDT